MRWLYSIKSTVYWGRVMVAFAERSAAEDKVEGHLARAGGNNIPNGTTDCCWFGWQTMEERNSSNTATCQYVWGTYVDECIQINLLQPAGPQQLAIGVYYPLQDTLHRAVALTNSGGEIQEAYDTDAYGNTIIFTGPGADNTWFTDDDTQSSYGANDIIYCGYRYDAETENYYVRNRYYSPTLGRWLTRDPIGYAGGIKLYGYVNSSPVGAADPMGDKLIIVAFEGLFGYGQAKTEGGKFYGGNHPGSSPQQVLNGRSGPYLNEFLIKTKAWTRGDTIVKYYPEYSIGRAVSQVTPMLTKPIGGSGPDKCKYNTILVVGFSNGGSAALRFAGRLAQKGIKVNAGFTVDPIAQGLQWLGHVFSGEGHFFFKPRTTAKWINFYQHGDNDYFGVLQGNPVRGAENTQLFAKDFAPLSQTLVFPNGVHHSAEWFYTGAHMRGWILRLSVVRDSFEGLMNSIPTTRSNFK